MKHARPLKVGDTIGIAAPASPFDRNEFKHGVTALEHMGFKVFYQHDIFDQERYLAGSDARRAAELTALFQNAKIDAIMFARGGYGSQRIIPLLNADLLRAHPKPVIGFSDITALLNFLRQSCAMPTFYGPVLTMLAKHKEEMTAERLKAAITAGGPLGGLPRGESRVLREGEAAGKLVGGCLSLLASSMGTPYELQSDGAILFIEEVGEKVYVIDRMLTQLKNAGVFARARGVIVGSIVQQEGEKHDLEAMLKDVLGEFSGPVITDFPAGHTHPFVTLPLGVEVQLVARPDTISVTVAEGAFA